MCRKSNVNHSSTFQARRARQAGMDRTAELHEDIRLPVLHHIQEWSYIHLRNHVPPSCSLTYFHLGFFLAPSVRPGTRRPSFCLCVSPPLSRAIGLPAGLTLRRLALRVMKHQSLFLWETRTPRAPAHTLSHMHTETAAVWRWHTSSWSLDRLRRATLRRKQKLTSFSICSHNSSLWLLDKVKWLCASHPWTLPDITHTNTTSVIPECIEH